MDIVERLEDYLRFNAKDELARDAKAEIERLYEVLHEIAESKKAVQPYADKIERLRYALMKVCNSLDDNLPAIITKNIALAALGLPLRGMKEGE